jgi:hypothetical protein
MGSRRRGGRLVIFLLLTLVFVIMLAVTLTHGSTPPCQGLSCPSGGGIAQDADGVGRGLDDIGTFLAGVAAFGSFILLLKGGERKTGTAK